MRCNFLAAVVVSVLALAGGAEPSDATPASNANPVSAAPDSEATSAPDADAYSAKTGTVASPAKAASLSSQQKTPPVQSEPVDQYREGTNVLARWPLEDWFYPGTVMSVQRGRYLIAYRDGTSSFLERSDLRPDSIAAGSRVFCNWQFLGAYFPGRVVSRNGDRIEVAYDDGDFESTNLTCVRTRG
jgi:hypothetical protein